MRAAAAGFAGLVILTASGAGGGAGAEPGSGTMDNPLHLDCRVVDRLLARADVPDAPVVDGDIEVAELRFDEMPPVIIGCGTGTHIVCVMEAPMDGVRVGQYLHIDGRLSFRQPGLAVVDPCGPSE